MESAPKGVRTSSALNQHCCFCSCASHTVVMQAWHTEESALVGVWNTAHPPLALQSAQRTAHWGQCLHPSQPQLAALVSELPVL